MSTTTTLEAVEVIKERIDLLFITSAGVVIPSDLIANHGGKKNFWHPTVVKTHFK